MNRPSRRAAGRGPDRHGVLVFDPSRPRTAAPRHLTPVEVKLSAPAVATVITSVDPLFALVNDLRTLTPEALDLIARYLSIVSGDVAEAR